MHIVALRIVPATFEVSGADMSKRGGGGGARGPKGHTCANDSGIEGHPKTQASVATWHTARVAAHTRMR